jgi:hypothetical protein
MFSILDASFISVFQWCIRQIELYTSYTRKKVVCNLLIFGALLTLLGMVVSDSILQRSSSLLTWLVLIHLPFLFVLFLDIFYALKKDDHSANALPLAVYERGGYRIVATVWSLVWLSIVLLGYQGTKDGLYEILDHLCFLTWCVVWIAEYALCTTSLPPGEKSKHKQQQNSSVAVPDAA